MVRGEDSDSQSYRRFVVAELRCARQRARLLMKEIEAIGIALSSGLIEPGLALEWLAEANGLDFLQPPEPPWERPETDKKQPLQSPQ